MRQRGCEGIHVQLDVNSNALEDTIKISLNDDKAYN